MGLGRVVDRIVKKKWSKSEIQRYIGNYRSAYLSYALDEDVRTLAASGGTTSALLIHGLTNGDFEGAVVCSTVIENGKVRAHFSIATTVEQVLDARGSKYVETTFAQEALPLIRNFQGSVAVVGLPCNIKALDAFCKKDPELNKKIALRIALLCGHSSRPLLIDRIANRLEQEAGGKLHSYRFRVGHWRGRLEADFDNGVTLRKKTASFNNYQNLYFFCSRRCIACYDHYGYFADISVGDVWLFRLKDNPIKHTGTIIRTETGQSLFSLSCVAGHIHGESVDIRDIMDGQSRIGPAHYNVSARSKAGKLLGIKLKDTVNHPVAWHAWLNAFISLANMRLSESEFGRKIIFIIPHPLLKGYLYFKKALESFK